MGKKEPAAAKAPAAKAPAPAPTKSEEKPPEEGKSSPLKDFITFLGTPNGKRLSVGLVAFFFCGTIILTSMYFAEIKKKEEFRMGVEMIRSFIIGLDSYYEDKDDFQILDAAQNLSEKMKDFADLNDEIKRVNEVIIGNLQAGWMIYNRNLYLITRDKNTWWESRRECQKEGSELVSIETQEEQVYITKHAKNKNIRVWIGLFKDKGTKWSWLGGSAVGSEYWPSGQPSRKPKHDCCAITPQTHRYSWHALLCDTKIQSCCKKEPDDKWL